jgi:hypothetical protein
MSSQIHPAALIISTHSRRTWWDFSPRVRAHWSAIGSAKMEEKITRRNAVRLCCDAVRLCCDAVRLCSGCAILLATCLNMIACNSSNPTPFSRRQTPPAPGFFERMKDEFTERGCHVGRFVCPYGLGPVGEPCECTDPSGVVVQGRTVR